MLDLNSIPPWMLMAIILLMVLCDLHFKTRLGSYVIPMAAAKYNAPLWVKRLIAVFKTLKPLLQKKLAEKKANKPKI